MERLYGQEEMKCAALETHDILQMIQGTEQDLREETKGQSHELWEVKQEPGQGIVLQHQVQKKRPPGMDQLIQQYQNRRVLVVGLGRNIKQFYRVLCDPEYKQTDMHTKPARLQRSYEFLDQRLDQRLGFLLFSQKNFHTIRKYGLGKRR